MLSTVAIQYAYNFLCAKGTMNTTVIVLHTAGESCPHANFFSVVNYLNRKHHLEGYSVSDPCIHICTKIRF